MKFPIVLSAIFAFSSVAAHAATYSPILTCDGLRLESVKARFLGKQVVINNVNNSFSNLGGALNSVYGRPFFIKKWDDTELVALSDKVKWNSEYAAVSMDRLITMDALDGGRAVVKVYAVSMLNEDDGIVNPNSIVLRGEHTFYNCHR